jgi:hypothetical protein
MLKWEYCILSGIETSLKRRMSVSLTFSNTSQEGHNFEIKLNGDLSEELFATRYLGELGREGWELVAFHRSTPKFEAVLKRPMDSKKVRSAVESGGLSAEAISGQC